MNFMNDVAPVMLYELPRAERADLALENIKEIDNFLDFEQCLIKEEAYAACGPFWEELPVILEEAQGATVLLAVVTTRKKELSLTWRWVDTGGRQKKNSSGQSCFPPLQPLVFQYPNAYFSLLEEPFREQALNVEAVFALLRKRHHELTRLRRALSNYTVRVQRDYRKVAYKKLPTVSNDL